MSKGNWNRLRQFAFLCFGILFLILLYIIQDLKNQIQILQTEIWFLLIIISMDSWPGASRTVRHIPTRFLERDNACATMHARMIWSNMNHFKAWLSKSWNRYEFVIEILWWTRNFSQCAWSYANFHYRKFQFYYLRTRCNGMWMHRRRKWYQEGFKIIDICKKYPRLAFVLTCNDWNLNPFKR